MEQEFHRFFHGHNDLVLAVSYNAYGTRLATASSDHRVRVWDRNDQTGKWDIAEAWTAHDAEVMDIKWAGPYVGEIIGTVGEDGLVRLWQELPDKSGRRFRKIYEHVSPTDMPYMSLDFKNVGCSVFLALFTADGHLSVLEPEDGEKLTSWRSMWAEHISKAPLGGEEAGFRLCWHAEKLPAWPAVLAGLDRKSMGVAVTAGDTVKVFRTDAERKWYLAATLEGAKGLVRDVSWANGSMRGFDLIATASKDGCVRIYELHTPGEGTLCTVTSTVQSTAMKPRSGIGTGLAGGARGRRDDNADSPGAIKQEAELVAEWETHNGAPWRVTWSPAGDVLVSGGDDGVVRMWKKANGKWLAAAEVGDC
ncbi:WD40 repeat-like protein [Piedraia hortae CBS 480.64]|uniref:WD40 repeat-like protein n=1 Tax=Piedraia hortae CBS 480.64 TaxID=1314780 RepID=A0A6A7CDR1_9PEZI|nr:WD40 repeat-like protein [Piedraia hortae CBS 480.64]